MMFAAMQLRDPVKLRRVLEEIDDCPFRGRVIEMEKQAVTGALAALDQQPDRAAEAWSEACRLADEVWPIGLAAMIWAEAGAFLGIEDPVGRSQASRAYDALAESGATTMLDIFGNGLLAPEDLSRQLGSA